MSTNSVGTAISRVARFRRVSSERTWGLILVAPVIGLFLLIYLVPAIGALLLSFTEFQVLQPPTWIGVENYQALWQSPLFRRTLVNSIGYAFGAVVPSVAISLAVAVGLNQKVRGLSGFRTAFYVPQMASWVSISMIWLYMLNPSFGVVNYALSAFGIPKISWLASPSTALLSIVLVGIWKNVGFGAVIYLAGLQGIPGHLYEAALVDGLNSWQRFVKITWPLLKPTTVFIVVIMGIFSLQAFDQVYVLTMGGPGNSTTTVVYEIYRNAFLYFKMGYASAMAVTWFAVILLISLGILVLTGEFKAAKGTEH